jgi:hypothetical protein
MKIQKSDTKLVLVMCVIVFLAAISRSSDIPNLTAMPAIAILLGAFAKRKALALGLFMVAAIVSDAYYGFHLSVWAVYLSYALMFGISTLYPKLKKSLSSIMQKSWMKNLTVSTGFAVSSSVLFFFVTNGAVWSESFFPEIGLSLYSTGFDGLLASYAAGLAFVREFGYPMLTSTLLFTVPVFMLSNALGLSKAYDTAYMQARESSNS